MNTTATLLEEIANLGVRVLPGCFNGKDAPCNPKERHEQQNVLQPESPCLWSNVDNSLKVLVTAQENDDYCE